MWWGYSAALDLIEEQKISLSSGVCVLNPLNVLIIGGGDGRHIIKTLSEINRHGRLDTEINFYIIEVSLELVARQMLLLMLTLEPPHILGVQEKSILFLEILGNAIVRPSTYNYIVNKSHQLIHMVTDLDFMNKRLPMVNIDNLKYRERDGLETIFKFWQQSKPKCLNIETLWDSRLRASLTNRYDSKLGVFDWDYHMKLCKLGQNSVSSAEYKRWRLKGIAYSWFGRVMSKPNSTLISGIQKINGDIISLGYRGDIENGPFATFGLQSQEDEKFKRQNPRKCTVFSQRNVMTILHGIVNMSEPISLPDESELEGAVLVDDRLESLCTLTDNSNESVEGNDKKLQAKEDYTAVTVGLAKVIFLPISTLSELHTKEKFKNIFDVIVFSHKTIDYFTPQIMKVTRSKSAVLVETLNFVLPPKKDINKLFDEKIDDLAKKCNCKPIQQIGEKEDFFKRFEFSREES